MPDVEIALLRGICSIRLAPALGAALLAGLLALPAWPFDLQGHRGTRGLAPENTLTAFRTALAIGVDTLELDVHLTRDGQVVIAHDPQLHAGFTRDAAGRWLEEPTPAIVDLTLAELQRYDIGRARPGSRYARTWPQQRAGDGERVPTLAALFDEVRARGAERVRLNIEIKSNPLEPGQSAPLETCVPAVLAVIEAHGMAARVSIQSFDRRAVRLVQRLAPAIPTAALTARQRWLDNVGDARWTDGLTLAAHGDSLPRLVKAAGVAIWSPYFGDLSEALVAEAHALGLTVVPWTVDDPAAIERLADWKVDGVITDYPDRARDALARRGVALPAPLR